MNSPDQIKSDSKTDLTYNVGLTQIEEAVMFYFKNVIKPTVVQNGNQIQVPVIYGTPERWKAVQLDGYYRDKNGKIQAPLIMFKRGAINKNRNLGNKLDANNPKNVQIFEQKYTRKNVYDRFSVINNMIPSKEFHGVITPDYINISYDCIAFTDYVEQMNSIVESMIFASDSYWGDPKKFKFRAYIDSYNNDDTLSTKEDRSIKSSFQINLQGHIIPKTVNAEIHKPLKWYSSSTFKLNTQTEKTVNPNEFKKVTK